jgi:hypothetical protein
MKISIGDLRRIVKKIINDNSPIGVGSPEKQSDDDYSYDFVSDPTIKKLVFNHLQALGSIDVDQKVGGFAWNQLEVWEIPYNTDPNTREFTGSITHNGKRYYGEY